MCHGSGRAGGLEEHSDEESDGDSDSIASEDDEENTDVPGQTGIKPSIFGLCDDRSEAEHKCDASLEAPIKVKLEPALFTICNEWPEHEFIGNKEMECVAREMAWHIIQQRDTEEVEEFLFATGDRASLVPTQVSRKRGVYMKKSRTSRPRPTARERDDAARTAFSGIGSASGASEPDDSESDSLDLEPFQSL